ncbi:ABC transporter family substrate-binding protein [Streptacidiphilus sp. N1-12]|uniref:ABC transporter family substrate-binding protein n=2 Tax=Streptacidiphilus alkalitolerans TaxID=3342712 RepID=A0ABV6VGD2_9ACTN
MAAGVALLLALAGCGSSGGGQAAKQSAPPKTEAQGINPQPLDKLRQGGTFKTSIQQWIEQYNPNQVDGTEGDGQAIVQMVEPSLFLADAQGVSHADPDFLLSAAVTSTSPQVVTYKLNPKAKWSDGKQLSWLDFQAMWKALNGTDQAYQVADSSGYDQIGSVEQGADPQEVKVTFKQSYGDWQRLFRTLLPASAYSTPDEFNKGWIEKIPVTGAAFKIGSYNKTTQTVIAVPDPDWWGTKPKLDKIIFQALGSTASTSAYLSGEIDYTSAVTPEAYKQLSAAPNTDIRTGSRWDEVHLTLNGAGGPLADVRVRQAIGEAIDRHIVATAAGKGLPFTPPVLDNHFFMPGQQGYQDNAGVYGTYDPAAARKLLDQAGWQDNGAGKPRTKDGKPLTLTYVLSNGSAQTSFDVEGIIAQMLQQVGVQLKLQKVPDNDFFDKYVNKGSFDITSFRNVDEIYASMLYSTFQQPTGSQVYGNYGRIGSAQVDQLLTRAGSATDPATARSLYNQADQLIWQSGHSLELYQRPEILAVRKGLANFGATGLADVDYTKIGWLK